MRKQISSAVVVFFCVAAPFASCQSVNLAGIAHVALRVADLEKSSQFYEALGFEKAFEFSDAGKITEQFIKINDHQFVELYPRTQQTQVLGLMHVCFEVTDIEALRSAYVKLGLNPSEVKKFRAGNLLFVLHDPDGQLLEYTQYLPGSLHAEDRGKHLGGRRVSEHLQGVATPVKDLASARSFYVGKLGFADSGSSETSLRLPGNSGDELELQPGRTSLGKIVFAVRDVKQGADTWSERGLAPRVENGTVVANDPDGTLVVFQPVRGNQKP